MAEIYDNTFVETARDKIVALLNALKTTMASGYDPTFSYVYDGHVVANLQLNAVSVDLDSLEASDEESYQGDPGCLWIAAFSVRVHTDYADGHSDGVKQARLLMSITNKFRKNRDLGDNYRLQDIGASIVNQEFSQSATLGGECTVEVAGMVQYTQE